MATPPPDSKLLVAMTSLSNSHVVLLSTVRTEILDVYGNAFPVRILLDSASQSNFITESCLRRGGFSRTKHRALVLAVNQVKATTTRGLTSFVIRVRRRDDVRFSVEATVLAQIASPIPNDKVEVKPWRHLEGLPLADPKYHLPSSIDVLLGAEAFVSVMRDGHRKGGKGEPDAFNTIFGWVLMGAVSPSLTIQPLHSFVTTLESLDAAVGKFWQLEEVPDHALCSDEDRRCEELFAQTTKRDHSGRFVVSYPFAKDPPCFVDSRSVAVSRLRALERRFRSNDDFRINYCSFIQDYLDSGHMELMRQPFPADGHIYYLPHYGVYKLDSTTTKLHVVFNASSKCTNRLSLNQALLNGPKLQQDIMAILLRFRVELVALTADVKQMFRQIWLNPAQCDYQRIVRRFSDSDPILDYILRTATFGITSSPYLAIRCLLHLATECRTKYPLAFAALTTWTMLASDRSVEEARALRGKLQSLLRSAGFELRKWASSHPAALDGLDPEQSSHTMLSFEPGEDQSLKVLGLRWHSHSDSFGFQVNPLSGSCTKRSILSELAHIFDPLGFLTPLTFTAKRLIQHLWTLKLDWDDDPPADICHRWERCQSEFGALASLRLPRSLAATNVIRRELHGFCDASEQGYGAVVYFCIVTRNEVIIRLLSAKSKVAPLRSITLPRLELCATLLLSSLIVYIKQALRRRLSLDAEHAWSDSMVARSWIRSSPHRWKTFVRNRVASIQENVAVFLGPRRYQIQPRGLLFQETISPRTDGSLNVVAWP